MIAFSSDVLVMLALAFGFAGVVLGFDWLRSRFTDRSSRTAAE